MKKIFLLSFLMISLCSCSIEDDTPNFTFDILPIESVAIPELFQLGSTYEISVSYFRPTGCHVFNNFFYEINENQRDVAVVTTVFEGTNCQTFDEGEGLSEASFNFIVTSLDTYTFRFWQGQDDNGVDTYLIVEIPVEQ